MPSSSKLRSPHTCTAQPQKYSGTTSHNIQLTVNLTAASSATQEMKITCRLTDGFVYTGETGSLKTLVEDIRRYTKEAKQPADHVQFIYRMPCSISHDSAARENIKGKITRSAFTHLGRLYNRGELHDDTDRKAVEYLRRHYDSYHHMGPEHNHLVRDEWVDRFGLGGTPDHVREKVREFIAQGSMNSSSSPAANLRKLPWKASHEM